MKKKTLLARSPLLTPVGQKPETVLACNEEYYKYMCLCSPAYKRSVTPCRRVEIHQCYGEIRWVYLLERRDSMFFGNFDIYQIRRPHILEDSKVISVTEEVSLAITA
jgi:hypothetical protein